VSDAGRQRPVALLAACGIAAALGSDALLRAYEMWALGGFDLAASARGALLLAVALALLWRPHPWLALAQAALALWVYADFAPIVGDLAAHGFAGLRMWLRPLPLAAFAFFPLAFFGWRALVRANAQPRAKD
jgi:hypothetical protein